MDVKRLDFCKIMWCVSLLLFGAFDITVGSPALVAEMDMVQLDSGNQVTTNNYMHQRQEIVDEERQERVGGEIVLNKDEDVLNSRLLALKKSEYDSAHYNGSEFAPQINFLKSKHLYDDSALFQIIKKMPKGSI